jgi:hypothetical protein
MVKLKTTKINYTKCVCVCVCVCVCLYILSQFYGVYDHAHASRRWNGIDGHRSRRPATRSGSCTTPPHPRLLRCVCEFPILWPVSLGFHKNPSLYFWLCVSCEAYKQAVGAEEREAAKACDGHARRFQINGFEDKQVCHLLIKEFYN